MTSAAPHHFHTFKEYLLIEEMSGVKHEYLNGEVVAMAGATAEHVALCTALSAHLFRAAAGGPCRVYGTDLGIRVRATGLATYPDVTVICGAPERDPESKLHYTNPAAIFEVLSPATESYDRGEKREHYQQIPSLREYFVLAQDRPHAERWSRDASGGWNHEVISADGEIVVESIGCSFSLPELYRSAGL